MAVVVYKTPGVKQSGIDHIEPLQLEEAVAYAESAKKAYRSALNEHSFLPNALPWGAIPMAAAALGLGISGTSGNPVTALGLTTATGLALGQWAQNKPREALYNIGFSAITCLLQSISPLRFIDSEKLRKDLETLNAERSTLAFHLQSLQNWIADAEVTKPTEGSKPTAEDIKKAITVYELGEEMLSTAQATISDGFKLYVTVQGAAYALVQNVDQVIAKVNTAIRDTQSPVAALASVVRGLSVVQPEALKDLKAKEIPGAPPREKEKPGGPGQKDFVALVKKTPERENVEEAMNRVARIATVVQQQVKAVQEVAVPSVATCLTVADTPGIVLRLTPPGDVELTQGETRRVAIAGGKPPYFPAWLKGPTNKDHLTPKQVVEGSAFYIELTAAAAAPSGEYELHISDSSTAEMSVKVKLKAKKEPLTVDQPKISLGAGMEKPVSVTGGNPQRYEVLFTPEGVTATFSDYDPSAKGRKLTVKAGNNAKAGKIVILDKSLANEAGVVTVTVDTGGGK